MLKSCGGEKEKKKKPAETLGKILNKGKTPARKNDTDQSRTHPRTNEQKKGIPQLQKRPR